MADPTLTVLRLPKVPQPNGIDAVSPSTRLTLSGVTPQRSAAICASTVSSPWLCLVAPAHFGGIQPQPRCNTVDAALHHEHRLRPSSATIGRVGHLVGRNTGSADRESGYFIWALKMGGRVVRVGEAHRIVSAVIQQEPIAKRQDMAFFIERTIAIGELVACARRA